MIWIANRFTKKCWNVLMVSHRDWEDEVKLPLSTDKAMKTQSQNPYQYSIMMFLAAGLRNPKPFLKVTKTVKKKVS